MTFCSVNDKLGVQTLPSRGSFPMVGDHSKQYKATVSVLDMVTCYIMQPSGLYLTTFLLIHRDCTSNSTKDTEKLCYKNHLNALCRAELAELQDILNMCKLPFFLYSFH